MEVVVLAGGAGRRFGSVKQLAPVAPDGATLLEVTLRDAGHAGCHHAVVVTAPVLADDFRSLFAERPVPGLDVTVTAQWPDDLPAPASPRDKPWGTAHALWAARHAVSGPFLVFNADDYYGPRAPATLAAALRAEAGHPVFALLGYPLGTTLSAEGTVSRAICETDDEGRLTTLREFTAIDGRGRADGRDLPLDAPVSMNAWGFTPAVFPLLEDLLRDFVAHADLAADEAFLPTAVAAAVQRGEVEVRVARAPDRWCGMTWPADRDRVVRRLTELEAPRRIAGHFGLEVTGAPAVPFGEGLIHGAWRVETRDGPHLLQRLNSRVFTDPIAVAKNAAAAAKQVDDTLRRAGDDDPRHRLVFRADPDDRPWARDEDGSVWRAVVLISGARSPDPARPGEVRAAARLLGRFPGLVAAGEGPELPEILPGFHDTEARFTAFMAAADADAHSRLTGCRAEYDRLVDFADLATILREADLPVRPVHNDAKLDNVLVDAGTGEPLCVVDLDTVMPGLAPHDFGDLVRSAVTGRPEDEPDLDRVVVRLDVFRDLAGGYLEGAVDWIESRERARLADGALAVTFEQALRFLADHLADDVYYAVDGPGHNLRRARAQLRLLEELLAVREELQCMVDDA